MNEKQTVFVVDDDQAARDSLRWLLESVGHNVFCHDSAQSFLDTYDGMTPGCLVLDVRMPGISGLELLNLLAERQWCLPVLIVTGHGDVPMAVRAMKSGALDFLQKPYNDQVLLDRIQQALELCRERQRHREEVLSIQHQFLQLTPREREVAGLVVAGKANKVIAQELGLSPKTIEVHRANVMVKMQAHSLSDLVQRWIRLETTPAPSVEIRSLG